MNPAIGIFFAVIIIILVVWWANKSDRKRSVALQEVAKTMELSFVKLGPGPVLDLLRKFSLLSWGYLPMTSDVMSGKLNSNNFLLADFLYQVSRARSILQTVLVINPGEIKFPVFTLQPEKLHHKIGSAVGFQDIDFESHPTFSDQYLLRGPDENAIRRLFSPEVIKIFEKNAKISIESDGGLILFFRYNDQIAPEDISTFIDDVTKIFHTLNTQIGQFAGMSIREEKEKQRIEEFNINFEYLQKQMEALPEKLECPNCSEMLALDENERISRNFTCPECNKAFNLSK